MGIEIIIKIDEAENKLSTDLKPGDDRMYVSDYARFFDESCTEWDEDPELNLLFLREQQNYATVILRQRGYLFLNEVYDILGMPRTKAGQVVGWVYDEKNPICNNFVDFDLYNQHNAGFINGYNRSVLLDFNVDGVILDRVL